MRIIRSLVCTLVVLAASAASAFALGFENGLDHFDNFLSGVRAAESDPAKQAALDEIRAKFSDPKITSRSANISAFTAGLQAASKLYGSPENLAAKVGAQIASVLAPMGIQLSLSEARAQQTLVTNPGISNIIALGKLVTAYQKSQDVNKHPDLFKRLKSMAKFAKKFDAFAKKHG